MIFNGPMGFQPRQDFGARHQQVFDREAMAEIGGGMGFMRRPNPNGGINPGGMYTGGNQRPFTLGGSLPPMFLGQGFQTGGNTPPQFMGLGRLFGANRMGAYR